MSEDAGIKELVERGLRLEDYPRRIYVRSALIQAHHAIALMEAEGFELIPYDGPYIPGTELIDVGEWEERDVDYIQDPATGKFQGSHPHGGDADKESVAGGGKIEPSKEAMAVGGDEWNKQTAERLEKEFVEAAPKLEEIVNEAVSTKAEVEADPQEPDPDNAPFVPEDWSMMSGDQQDEAMNDYKKSTYDDYLQSEQDNWYSESAPDDARVKVADDFTDGSEVDWAKDVIADFKSDWKDNGHTVPFTDQQILDALSIDYQAQGGGSTGDPDITIDDSKLGNPEGFDPSPSLPGIEPQKPEDFLTEKMRDDLTSRLEKGFEKEGDDVAGKMEPPDYLSDSIAEFQEQSWDGMSDKNKFDWTNSNTSIIDDMQKEYDEYFGESKPGGETGTIDALPKKFDPLQQNASAADYQRTQQIARHLSVERAAQIMVDRKIYTEIEDARRDAKLMDRRLWEAWKGSSHGEYGQLLQKATADELGGRLNPQMVTHDEYHLEQLSKDVAPSAKADEKYEAVKAYVRGKWETSQYLLKKAGVETVNVYRAVNIPDTAPPIAIQAGTGPGWLVSTLKTFNDEKSAMTFIDSEKGKFPDGSFKLTNPKGGYRVASTYRFDGEKPARSFAEQYQKDPNNPAQHTEEVHTPEQDEGRGVTSSTVYNKLPDIHVNRNGSASTTTDPEVANAWDGSQGRVVLRASVPRTAVVSLPAYGINVQGEHEVVVAGTAWKSWSAWYGQAPPFERIPEVKGTGIAA